MISESKTSKASQILAHTLRRRSTVIVLVTLCLLLLYPLGSPYLLPTPSSPLSPDLSPYPAPAQNSARTISASTLLSRPISTDRLSIPKLIHQTWFPAGSNMSSNAQKWVQTVKDFHPDWEYVLWDDESDLMLVERYFPWFLDTYRSLPKEINRADMVRNFYMFLFGGMYLDVDTEALRPVDTLFASHDVQLRAHTSELSPSSTQTGKKVQRAFMGRMAHTLDAEGLGAIPNGWMASPPGHPFFLLPVLAVLENPKGDGSVEGMTGPGILGPLIKQYLSSGGGNGDPDEGARLRRQLCSRIQSVQAGWDLFCEQKSLDERGHGGGIGHSLVLLPREQIYPFSWVDDGDVRVCLGAKQNELFDAEACKRRMGVEAWPSYFITYCTHTW